MSEYCEACEVAEARGPVAETSMRHTCAASKLAEEILVVCEHCGAVSPSGYETLAASHLALVEALRRMEWGGYGETLEPNASIVCAHPPGVPCKTSIHACPSCAAILERGGTHTNGCFIAAALTGPGEKWVALVEALRTWVIGGGGEELLKAARACGIGGDDAA